MRTLLSVSHQCSSNKVRALLTMLGVAVAVEVGVIGLGCTHDPLLPETTASVAADLAGRPVAVIDSGEATARMVFLGTRAPSVEQIDL